MLSCYIFHRIRFSMILRHLTQLKTACVTDSARIADITPFVPKLCLDIVVGLTLFEIFDLNHSPPLKHKEIFKETIIPFSSPKKPLRTLLKWPRCKQKRFLRFTFESLSKSSKRFSSLPMDFCLFAVIISLSL